jgi:hypothetical protein
VTDDPYAVLGVDRSASAEEVHQAWVAMARRHHPDRGGDPAAMRRVNEAWAQVRDSPPPATPPEEEPPDVEVEDVDLDLLDPRPLRPPRRSPFDLVPVAVFASSVAIGCLALALDAPAMLGFAAFLFFLSCVAVAAAALLSMRR